MRPVSDGVGILKETRGPMIDVNDLRRPASLLHGLVSADDAYTLYYDETNNIRRLLLAGDARRAGRTPAVIAAGMEFVARLPGCRRLVFEPDARNAPSVALLERLGAERGPLVDLRTSISEKPAQFFFLTRQQALAVAAASRSGQHG